VEVNGSNLVRSVRVDGWVEVALPPGCRTPGCA
jgi:hypothetical protein